METKENIIEIINKIFKDSDTLYGLKEFSYYTVLFSVSRALGICSQAIVARAMGYAITRPKSLPTAGYQKIVSIPANA